VGALAVAVVLPACHLNWTRLFPVAVGAGAAGRVETKVSLAGARDDYGVVLVPGVSSDSFTLHEPATLALRAKLQAGRGKDRPIIDRGEGYEKMIRGEVVPWTRTA